MKLFLPEELVANFNITCSAIKQGQRVEDLCRELGIRAATFYGWRKKYSGMEASQLKRLKELEEENRKLKQMYADQSLDNMMLKDILSKKF